MTRITAAFPTEAAAQNALGDLRTTGVTDAHLSVIRSKSDVTTTEPAGDVTSGLGTGMLTGAGVGTLLGLVALAIPGIGPIIGAGALATSLGAAAGSAAVGAAAGAALGGITGALINAGYSAEDAQYYGDAIQRGEILVIVDTDGSNDAAITQYIRQHGGTFRA